MYLEDYYSIGLDPKFPSLRDSKSTMKSEQLVGLDKPYKIPIIHYKNSCPVKLTLVDTDNPSILRENNASHIQYKIGDQIIELSKEFIVQTPPNGTILDIKDDNGAIKGKLEFRQINEPLLQPIVNIVIVDGQGLPDGYDFASLISNLNNVYNTMNVNWQKGIEVKVNTVPIGSAELEKKISEVLEKSPDYKKNQYYIIPFPKENTGAAGFTIGLGGNYLYLNTAQPFSLMLEDDVVAHELGHCSGLDEISINIGAASASDRTEAQTNDYQFKSSNVMGYRRKLGGDTPPKRDFYSWQIQLIRESIQKRLNNK